MATKTTKKKVKTEEVSKSISNYKPAEVEEIITKLSRQGNTASKIGLILRDSYGIPNVREVLGKKLTVFLTEQKLAPSLPEDLNSLLIRAVQTGKHMEQNKKDMVSKRGLQLIEAKIRRLVKYYKRIKRLPSNWKYTLEGAKLLVS